MANYIVKEVKGILELNESMLRNLKYGHLEKQRIEPDTISIKYYKSNNERVQKDLKLWILGYTEHCLNYHELMLENYNRSFIKKDEESSNGN